MDNSNSNIEVEANRAAANEKFSINEEITDRDLRMMRQMEEFLYALESM